MSEKDIGKKCDTSCVPETDISHTPPKRTRRHLIHEKIKYNDMAWKQKSCDKATPPGLANGQSRNIIPTENTLANDKLSNNIESRHNACLGIKMEPQEEESEKSLEHFEMIDIKFKFEQTQKSESNDPLDNNINQAKEQVQALQINDQQELFNGKEDVPFKQVKPDINKTEEELISQTAAHTKQMGIWQPRLAVSHDQIMVLLAELQEDPEAARGFSRMAEGRRRNKRFWTQLARTLNAVRGGAHKNADGWAKYWQDKKRNVKASVARREAACRVTGGDDLEVRTPLTDVEQRVAAIMGGLAFANGDAELRVPVFCGEGPRNSAAAAASAQSSSDDSMMLDSTSSSPSMWMEVPITQEDARLPRPEQAPPPSSSSPPSPPTQSAPPPPSQSRNTLKSAVSENRAVEDDNLALLRSQHEEKMAVERERNLLLRQMVEKVDKAVGMLGDVLARIPR